MSLYTVNKYVSMFKERIISQNGTSQAENMRKYFYLNLLI